MAPSLVVNAGPAVDKPHTPKGKNMPDDGPGEEGDRHPSAPPRDPNLVASRPIARGKAASLKHGRSSSGCPATGIGFWCACARVVGGESRKGARARAHTKNVGGGAGGWPGIVTLST